MLIHSVTPPHMLNEPHEYPQMAVKPFPGGYLEGVETPDGFQLSRLLSTDPNLYLDSKYMPGGICK